MNAAEIESAELPSYEKEFLKLALLPWVEIVLKFWAMDEQSARAFVPALKDATYRYKSQQDELAPLFPSRAAMNALESVYLDKLRIADGKPFFPDARS